MARPDADRLMMQPTSNPFGPVYPTEQPERMAHSLGLHSTDRVLDVGGGGSPFIRADFVVDYDLAGGDDRDRIPATLDERWVCADASALPFADRSFDFVYCTHVLEHVRDPRQVAREFSRIAPRGFIETPRKMTELYAGYPSHRWLIELRADTLVFEPRWYIESPFHNCLQAQVHRFPDGRGQALGDYRNICCVQLAWQGELKVEVVEDASAFREFDYDRIEHAAWSHFYYALNLLANGDHVSFVIEHARIACRSLPGESDFQHLLAICEWLNQQVDAARSLLRNSAAGKDAFARSLLAEMDRDPECLELPMGRGLAYRLPENAP